METFALRPNATPDSVPTHLGAALDLVLDRVAGELRLATTEGKGDWAPLLFVMTDGKPSDTQAFEAAATRIGSAGFAAVVGCAAGPRGERATLERFCNPVASLDTMDGAGFARFFRWVSDAIVTGSRGGGAGSGAAMPPPPDEIRLAP